MPEKKVGIREVRIHARRYLQRFSKKTLAKALAAMDLNLPSVGIWEFCEQMENPAGKRLEEMVRRGRSLENVPQGNKSNNKTKAKGGKA